MSSSKLFKSTLTILLALTILVGMMFLLGTWGSKAPAALAQGGGTVRYVAPGGADSGNCTNVAAPCATLQYAVDQAAVGDEIRVAAGTYTALNNYGGLSQVLYLTKTLTLRGGYSTDFATWNPEIYTTTLDAHGGGRVVYIAGVITPTIEGFRLTGGSAAGLGGDLFGNAGGGVYILSATVTLSRNVIIANQAVGGFFEDGLGGGLYAAASAPILRHNLILDNQAAGGSWGAGSGGGLYFSESRPTLEANQVRDNQAGGDFGTGGGLALMACPGFTLTNNIVADNHATYGGSGIYIGSLSGVPSRGWLRHTTIAHNQDSGVAGLRVAHGGSVVTLTNTILAGHDIGISVSSGSTATLTATLWSNATDWDNVGAVYTGTINLWGDPQFLNPGGGDYHIASSSPAVDAGVDAGIATDIDGEARDANPDLGADEAGGQGLRMTKVASATDLYPGETVTYTLVVTNSGSLGVTNVVLTDNLPARQRPLAASVGCTISDGGYGGRVTCPLGDLGVGQAGRITLTAQVTTTLPPTLPWTMRNSAVAVGDQAQGSAFTETLLHEPPNCHVRVNGALPEYTTVQAGVDAAVAGDELWIAGICRGAFARAGLWQQVYISRSLTLRGGYSPDFSAWDPGLYTTTLDAGGQGRVVYVRGPVSVTLEALHLTGGDATGLGGLDATFDDMGGGLYAISATVTLSRCQVADNLASRTASGWGGGVGVTTATLTLVQTTLAGNVASDAGLGLGHGGGLAARFSTVRLEKSRLMGNTAATSLAGLGGGSYVAESRLEASATLWLSNTTSAAADWGRGGGLYVEGSRPFTLTNCVLADNRAYDAGGESGSGLWVDGAAGVLLHPTLARNGPGEGLTAEYSATVNITNAIVVSHQVGIRALSQSTVTVNGVLWHDNISDTLAVSATVQVGGALGGDPAFAADGYHITKSSAAREGGLPSGVPNDVDGDLRPWGCGYDLGADEYADATGGRAWCLYLPLVTRNE